MYFNHILDRIVAAYSLQQLYFDMWFTFYLPAIKDFEKLIKIMNASFIFRCQKSAI